MNITLPWQKVNQPLTVQYAWTKIEWDLWNKNSSAADLEYSLYKNARRGIIDYMERNQLVVNPSYTYHKEGYCDLNKKICFMTIVYGPINRVPLSEILTKEVKTQ